MIRKYIAGFLAALFISLFSPFILTFSAYDLFSDRNFYEDDFSAFTYDIVIDYLPTYLGSNFSMDGSSNFTKLVKREFLEEVFTLDDYRIFIRSVIKSLGDSGFENGYYSVSIPIASVFSDKIDSLSRDSREFLVLSSLPPSFDFSATVSGNISGGLFEFVEYMFYRVFLLTLSLLLLILLVIGFLISHPWKLVLKWEARTIFMASLLAFATAVLLVVLPDRLPLEQLPSVNLFLPLYVFLAKDVFLSSLYYVVPLSIFSFILWTFAIYFGKNEEL